MLSNLDSFAPTHIDLVSQPVVSPAMSALNIFGLAVWLLEIPALDVNELTVAIPVLKLSTLISLSTGYLPTRLFSGHLLSS